MSHAAADLRGLDCQSNPFLLALQNANSRVGRHLSALYQRVALEGGLVLLPPPQSCPSQKGKFEEKWAKNHVLLPLPVVQKNGAAAAATGVATGGAGSAASAASVAPVGSIDSEGDSVLSRSASGSTADSTAADSSPLSAPLSSWLRPDATSLSPVVHISSGCIYIGAEGESGASAVARTEPRARILLEELHYDEDFRSFRVLAIDQPLCGPKGEVSESVPVSSAAAGAGSAAAANGAAGGKKAGARRGASSDSSSQNLMLPSHSAGNPAVAAVSATSPHAALHRPELRSLSLQRDVLTGVLGADVSTRSIFASPRLDFFFTDFSLAWLGTVANAGEKAAEHVRLACNRTLKEAIAMIKAAPSHGGKDSAALSAAAAASLSAAALGAFPVADAQPATAKSLANWSPARYAELEVAIQAHVHSCLHGKIFTSTLARMPLHRLAGEQLLKSMQAIDAATAPRGCTLFDVGLSAELVGLVDPRPAIEQMKALNSFVTPLERLACLAKVEALLLESINAAPKNNAATTTAAATAAASDNSRPVRPPLNRGATLSSIPDQPSSAAAARSSAASSSALPTTSRSRSNSHSQPSASVSTAEGGETSLPAPSSLMGVATLNASSADGSSAGSVAGGSSALSSFQTGSPLSSSLAQPGTASAASSSLNLAALSVSPSAASDAASPLGGTAASTTTTTPPPLNPALVKSATMAPSLTAPAASSSSSSSRGSHHKSSASSFAAPQQLSVSADDLLPLLVFVLLEARPLHLHANVAYMRLFAPGAELLTPSVHSELLYRLANLEAAVSYVESGRLLQHIREAQASRLSAAPASGAAAAGKKPRSRMSSISLQSTKTLHLLLTPAPQSNSSGNASGGGGSTSSRRNLFRRDSAEASAEGGDTSADAATAAAARIASPFTGSSAGASRALSPADGASSGVHEGAEDDDESSFLDDDVEGIDEEDDDALPIDAQLHALHLQQQHQLLMQSAASADAGDDGEDKGESSEAEDLFSVAASKLRRSHLTSELSSNGLGSSSSHAFVPSSSAGSAATASSAVAVASVDVAAHGASAAPLSLPLPGPVTNAASALFGESLPDPEPLLLEGASTLPAWLFNEDAHTPSSAHATTSDAAAKDGADESCIDESDPVSLMLYGGGGGGGGGGRAHSLAAPSTRRRSTAVVSSTLPPSLSFSSVLGSASLSPNLLGPPPRVKSPAVFAPFLPRSMSMQHTTSTSSSAAATEPAGGPAPAASPALESSASASSASAVALRHATVAAEEDPLGALLTRKKKSSAAL